MKCNKYLSTAAYGVKFKATSFKKHYKEKRKRKKENWINEKGSLIKKKKNKDKILIITIK